MATDPSGDSLNNSLTNVRGAIPLNDAFERLRWSVFEDVSNILVLDEPKTQKPGLSPFKGHVIAAELASKIPLTEIAFCIDDLDANELPDYKRPKPLLVSRAGGGTVTVADVVEQLSAYILTHKEDILMVKEACLEESAGDYGAGDGQGATATLGEGQGTPANIRVFFEGFFGIIEPTMESLPVVLWAEGEAPSSLDERLIQ
jgi:hypothetical protein